MAPCLVKEGRADHYYLVFVGSLFCVHLVFCTLGKDYNQQKKRFMRLLFALGIVLTFSLTACGPNNEKVEEEVEVVKGQVSGNDVEAKLKELGITLPAVPPPVANYVNAVRTGNLVFMAGKGPNRPEGGYVTGKVGRDLTVEEGYEAAKLAAIIQLAALKAEIGDLNKVKRIVKVLGMVNAMPEFTDHPEVINGFSDLMVAVFGDKGKHARAAVGMGSLPRNIAVEIEMIVEVE